MSPTSVSVLIPFRPENLWRLELCRWNLRRWEALFPEAEIVAGDAPGPFNRGAAINSAARASSGDVLILADSDTVPQPELRSLVWPVPETWAIGYGESRYYNLLEASTRRLLLGDPAAPVGEPAPAECEFVLTSWSGLVVLSRAAFDDVGGYDEKFRGWGYEDNAMCAALDTVVGAHDRLASYAVHLWHPVGRRFDQPFIEHNRALYERYRSCEGDPAAMSALIGER